MSLWIDIERGLNRALDTPHRIQQRRAVRGGCINSAWAISCGAARYFVKVNTREGAAMFEAEAAALREMAAAEAVRVPLPIACGVNDAASWIVLEHLELAPRSSGTDARLGSQLAALHRTMHERCGFERDNWIGSTPQRNGRSSDWVAFWRERRLGFQLARALDNGHPSILYERGHALLERIGELFTSYAPQYSLLHGDLWSGNAASLVDGTPVVFDPAVYYGDRETDIAMTELFGGFARSFYDAYRGAFPLDAGYALRKDLYNLYHVLNHLNLFGATYLARAQHLIDSLLAELNG